MITLFWCVYQSIFLFIRSIQRLSSFFISLGITITASQNFWSTSLVRINNDLIFIRQSQVYAGRDQKLWPSMNLAVQMKLFLWQVMLGTQFSCLTHFLQWHHQAFQCPVQCLDLKILVIQVLQIYFLFQLVILRLHQALSLSAAAETPLRSSSLTSGSLGRLLAPRRYNLKDDMEIFSPLLEVQPNTHSFDLMWDGSKGSKKDFDYNSSNSFPSGSFALSEAWKTSSTTKQVCYLPISAFFFSFFNQCFNVV